jgi:holliday junction DNA helicase RuvA
MISFLKGTIAAKTENTLIIVTNDVGFEVTVPAPLWRTLAVGAVAECFTHEYVREDSRELYGFGSLGELQFFRKLISISGVGPKVAVHVMSLGVLKELQAAIAAGNIAFLTAIPGVGKKIAQKIVLEMKGKLDLTEGVSLEEQESIEALESLGYTKAQAREALRRVAGDVTDVSDRVRAALKVLGQKVR